MALSMLPPKPLETFAAPSFANKVRRAIWNIFCVVFYRTVPTPMFFVRRVILRLFGASIAHNARPYPRAKIFAPWNLVMAENSCIANDVQCYNVATITIGKDSIVSQRAHLCSASHDFRSPDFELVASSIEIEEGAWVAAEAFIGPGVAVHKNAVVGARAVVNKSVPAGVVIAGNPANIISMR